MTLCTGLCMGQFTLICYSCELPRWCRGKQSVCQCRRCKRRGFDPWVGKIPWGRKWQPTPVFLLGKSHVQRSLVGCSPWGHKESDMTEPLSTRMHYILCVGYTVGFHALFFSPCSFVSQWHLTAFDKRCWIHIHTQSLRWYYDINVIKGSHIFWSWLLKGLC